MKGRTCVNCIHYDGQLCELELEKLDINDDDATAYKAPFYTCDEHEEDYEEDDE